MKKSRFPDSLVLIFGMIFLAQVATWMLPAGAFEYKKDDEGAATRAIVPGSYKPVITESEAAERKADDPALTDEGISERFRVVADGEAPRLPWYAFLTKVLKGMQEAGDIIFFVFLVGGVIGVLKATGAFDALIGTAIRSAKGSSVLLVAGMITLFAVGSSTIGMAEEYMPFIPVLVTMCIALGMDAIVAVGIVYIGAGIGYGCAAINPFTVLIAQNIAGLEPTSGQGFRWILLVVCLAVGIQHILRYVHRIQKDPSRSLVRDIDYSTGYEMPEDTRFTSARCAVLLTFAAGVALFVWGVAVHGWYLEELAGVFLGIMLIAALIARFSPNRVARDFCSGAAELTTAALLIGFARTIQVVLDDGMVTHTIVHGVASALDGFAPAVAASGMLFVQSACNFLIPSGSGQAYVTMPIMAPLADLLGVSRQTAVLAYQFGDGFMNMVVPTNALLMGMLGLGRIPYQRWLRFIVPLILEIYIVAIIALTIAVKIQY